MRRTPVLRQENQIALALAEIERLKAIATRTTDGRVIVSVPGSTPGDGHTSDGDLVPLETSPHVLHGSKHTNSFLVTAAEGVSLTIFIQAGQLWAGGSFRSLSETTLQMADATTNYVYVSAAGAITSNTVSFPADGAPLATVVTAGGDITSVNDRRSYLSTGGAVVGSLHDADQIIDDDGDTSVEVERGVDDDTIRLKAATVDVALIAAAGQWQLPITGIDAGLLVGGDALWYRSDADVWRTPDAVVIDDQLDVTGSNGIRVGIDDTIRGILRLYGSGAASTQGGRMQFFLAADHDATFESWGMDVDEDNLRFFTSDGAVTNTMTAAGRLALPAGGSGAGILVGGDCLWYRTAANVWRTPDVVVVDGVIIGSSTINATGGLQAGADDATRGTLRLFGAGAGSTQGGEFRMFLAADHDGTFEYWAFDVDSDDLRIFSSDAVAGHKFLAGGNVELGGAVQIAGALNHDGASVGFYGTAPVAKPGATSDLIDGLLSQGLVTAGSAVGYYANMYAYDVADTIVFSGTGIANKIQVTSFATNGEALGATPDHTNDHITIDQTGKYLVTVSMSCSSDAGSSFLLGYACYKNNGATLLNALHGHRDLAGGGGDTGSMSMSAIIAFTATDTLEVWVWNETNTVDIIMDDIMMSVVRVGD